MRNWKKIVAIVMALICINYTVFPTLFAASDPDSDSESYSCDDEEVSVSIIEAMEEAPSQEVGEVQGVPMAVDEDLDEDGIEGGNAVYEAEATLDGTEESAIEESAIEESAIEESAIEAVQNPVESNVEYTIGNNTVENTTEVSTETSTEAYTEIDTKVYDIDTDTSFEAVDANPVFATIDEEISNVISLNGGDAPFATFDANGLPNYIDGTYTDKKVSNASDAISSLNYIHNVMGFVNAEQEFTEVKSKYVETPEEVENLNLYRLQQTYHNIPVYGYQIVVATNETEDVKALAGHYYPNIDMEITPVLTMEEAKAIGLSCDEQTDIVSDGLYIYVDDETGDTTLCWKIRTIFKSYFLDAQTGELVADVAEIRDAETVGVGISLLNEAIMFPVSEENGTYILKDELRNIYVYDAGHSYYEKSSPITSSSNTDWNNYPEAITAYTNVIRIFDYYAAVLGRNGANNARERINLYTNYRYDKPGYLDANGQYDNAFYTTSSKGQVLFAIGDGNNISRALDVLAHEYTHAVDANEWGAIYKGESGALDEAYADILGELIETGSLSEMGEDMTRGSVRNFVDPSNPGDKTQIRQPSNYANRYVGSGDYGGVHVNSGIVNHAAYLIDQNWPTPDHSYELVALFYASMDYLTPNSTFIDCRNALYAAAKTLNMGEDKINVIIAAFQSVGVG
jgi:Zn-dependent metalloprotease